MSQQQQNHEQEQLIIPPLASHILPLLTTQPDQFLSLKQTLPPEHITQICQHFLEKYTASLAELQVLQQQYTDVQGLLSERNRELAVERERVGLLESELDGLRVIMEEGELRNQDRLRLVSQSSHSRIQEIEHQLQKQRQNTVQYKHLQSQLQQTEKKLSRLENQLKILQQQGQQLQRYKHSNASLLQKISTLQHQLEAVGEIEKYLRTENSQLVSKVQILEQRNIDLEYIVAEGGNKIKEGSLEDFGAEMVVKEARPQLSQHPNHPQSLPSQTHPQTHQTQTYLKQIQENFKPEYITDPFTCTRTNQNRPTRHPQAQTNSLHRTESIGSGNDFEFEFSLDQASAQVRKYRDWAVGEIEARSLGGFGDGLFGDKDSRGRKGSRDDNNREYVDMRKQQQPKQPPIQQIPQQRNPKNEQTIPYPHTKSSLENTSNDLSILPLTIRGGQQQPITTNNTNTKIVAANDRILSSEGEGDGNRNSQVEGSGKRQEGLLEGSSSINVRNLSINIPKNLGVDSHVYNSKEKNNSGKSPEKDKGLLYTSRSQQANPNTNNINNNNNNINASYNVIIKQVNNRDRSQKVGNQLQPVSKLLVSSNSSNDRMSPYAALQTQWEAPQYIYALQQTIRTLNQQLEQSNNKIKAVTQQLHALESENKTQAKLFTQQLYSQAQHIQALTEQLRQQKQAHIEQVQLLGQVHRDEIRKMEKKYEMLEEKKKRKQMQVNKEKEAVRVLSGRLMEVEEEIWVFSQSRRLNGHQIGVQVEQQNKVSGSLTIHTLPPICIPKTIKHLQKSNILNLTLRPQKPNLKKCSQPSLCLSLVGAVLKKKPNLKLHPYPVPNLPVKCKVFPVMVECAAQAVVETINFGNLWIGVDIDQGKQKGGKNNLGSVQGVQTQEQKRKRVEQQRKLQRKQQIQRIKKFIPTSIQIQKKQQQMVRKQAENKKIDSPVTKSLNPFHNNKSQSFNIRPDNNNFAFKNQQNLMSSSIGGRKQYVQSQDKKNTNSKQERALPKTSSMIITTNPQSQAQSQPQAQAQVLRSKLSVGSFFSQISQISQIQKKSESQQFRDISSNSYDQIIKHKAGDLGSVGQIFEDFYDAEPIDVEMRRATVRGLSLVDRKRSMDDNLGSNDGNNTMFYSFSNQSQLYRSINKSKSIGYQQLEQQRQIQQYLQAKQNNLFDNQNQYINPQNQLKSLPNLSIQASQLIKLQQIVKQACVNYGIYTGFGSSGLWSGLGMGRGNKACFKIPDLGAVKLGGQKVISFGDVVRSIREATVCGTGNNANKNKKQDNHFYILTATLQKSKYPSRNRSISSSRFPQSPPTDHLLLWKQGLASLTLSSCLVMPDLKKYIYDPVDCIMGNCEVLLHANSHTIEVKRAFIDGMTAVGGGMAEGKGPGKKSYFVGDLTECVWRVEKIQGWGSY